MRRNVFTNLVAGCLFLFFCIVPPCIEARAERCQLHLLTGADYYYALKDAVDQAHHSIFLAIYLFKTDKHPSNRATAILLALVRAAHRGVNITALLERNDDPSSFINIENERTGKRLQEAGANVYWDRVDRKLHIKAIVIDRQIVFLGSHNLTHSAMKYNQEMSLVISDAHLADQIIKKISSLPKTPFKRQP